jgi:hypothetical protein
LGGRQTYGGYNTQFFLKDQPLNEKKMKKNEKKFF